jgi:hypothetical protein
MWVAQKLRGAGIAVAPLRSITADGLLRQAEAFGHRKRSRDRQKEYF